jgi:hypothetical protein
MGKPIWGANQVKLTLSSRLEKLYHLLCNLFAILICGPAPLHFGCCVGCHVGCHVDCHVVAKMLLLSSLILLLHCQHCNCRRVTKPTAAIILTIAPTVTALITNAIALSAAIAAAIALASTVVAAVFVIATAPTFANVAALSASIAVAIAIATAATVATAITIALTASIAAAIALASPVTAIINNAADRISAIALHHCLGCHRSHRSRSQCRHRCHVTLTHCHCLMCCRFRHCVAIIRRWLAPHFCRPLHHHFFCFLLIVFCLRLNYFHWSPPPPLPPASTTFIDRCRMITIRPHRGESPKDVIFYEKRLIFPVWVLLFVGVFEPKCPIGLGHWGKLLCNIHIAIFHPCMHIAYCNMNMGMQYGYFSSK